jgi:hypothetical protein
MSTHAHNEHAHGGHEHEDFEGTYAIWAIPFSMAMLATFVFIVVLWVPAAASKEMKFKETSGAELSRSSLVKHRDEQKAALGDIEKSMDAVVGENASR